MSITIVDKILSVHAGARFVKADLHIHTPASKDWIEKNPNPENQLPNIKPKDFVDAALKQGLGLIAITDHNSVEWCELIGDEAKGTDLVVLPGFEITVNPGVHLLAIFEQGKKCSELEDLLIQLGIPRGRFGDAGAMTTSSISDRDGSYKVVRELCDAGALVIPAHLEVDSGLVGRLKGGEATRDFLINAGCRFLEITNFPPPEVVKELLKENGRRFAFVTNSDSHNVQRIGAKFTWLKLDSINLDGLKQVCFEPNSRIYYDSSKLDQGAHIVGMFADGGVFAGQSVGLNCDLNCIIGGRGAGKSAFLDFLRFVLGDEPEAAELKERYISRLHGLIEHGTTVSVLVKHNDEYWLHERKLDIKTEKHKGRDVLINQSGPTTHYQVLLDEQRTVKFENEFHKFPVDFYSQGEVQSITFEGEPNRQLRLVDNFIRANLEARFTRERDLTQTIIEIEENLESLEKEFEEIEAQLLMKPSLESRRSELEASLNDEVLKNHQNWEAADRWIEKIIAGLEKRRTTLSSANIENHQKETFQLLSVSAPSATVDSSKIDELDRGAKAVLILQKVTETASAADASAEELYSAVKDGTQKAVNDIKALKGQWKLEYEAERDEYQAVLRERKIANLAALNEELARTNEGIALLTTTIEPRKEELTRLIKTAKASHKSKVAELYKVWAGITDARKYAADEMTKRLNAEIQVSLSPGSDLSAYHDILKDAVPPGTRSEIVELTISRISPSNLVSSIYARDEDGMKSLGLSDNAVTRLLQIQEKHLRELERTKCEDVVEIKLRVGESYKSLSTLSDGEKCTAVLSIILLDESRPLVIDQPEDELDHDFIMQNVVDILSSVKQKCDPLVEAFKRRNGRQFVIATHNQNIPVLGDAELVIRMKKVVDSNKCEPISAHGMDHPETLRQVLTLEGGAEAFERRREKYASQRNK